MRQRVKGGNPAGAPPDATGGLMNAGLAGLDSCPPENRRGGAQRRDSGVARPVIPDLANTMDLRT